MTEFSQVFCGYKIKSSRGFKISIRMHLSQKYDDVVSHLLIAFAEVKFLHLEFLPTRWEMEYFPFTAFPLIPNTKELSVLFPILFS